MTTLKKCRLCKHTYDINDFYKGDTRCKVCVLALKKEQRDNWTPAQKEQAAVSRKEFAATPNGYYSMYISNAKVRGMEFTLTKDEFLSYWQESCRYCGDQLKGVGLDRVDNTIGYTKGNVVPCCTQCNMMKKDLTKRDFVGKITSIYKHLNLGEQL